MTCFRRPDGEPRQQMDSECDLHQSGLQGEGRQQPRHPGAGEHARGGSDETFCTFVPTATESINF